MNYNYMPYFAPQAQPQQSMDERIWVQNETSAEAYLVAPNSFVRLWDSNRPVFYEKRADASGRPYPMETYEYKKVDSQKTCKCEDYSKQFDDINERLSKLERRLSDESESVTDNAAVEPVQPKP